MKIRLTEAGQKVVDSIEIPEAVREQFESIFREGKLALFMTYGMSLKKWDEAGILGRELKPYNELAKKLELIYIVTYGAWATEHQYQKQLPKNVIILCNNTILPDALYSLFVPWIHKKVLKGTDYFKSNQVSGSWGAVIAKKLFGKKLFIRQGYPWLQTLQEKKAPLWKRIIAELTEKLAYNASDGIIVTTDRDKLQIQKNYSVAEPKIHIIPNYIDINRFKPDPALRIPNRVLFVGRMAPEKNLLSLISAVKGLDVELIMIGEGEIKQQLIKITETKGINNVRFPLPMKNEELVREYNKADIFILPSKYEGNPKVLMEAMSCGCIVIGTNVRGINEVIEDGENGFLCEQPPTHINAAICRAQFKITEYSKKADNIRNKARETIVNRHSLQGAVLKELHILRGRFDLL